MRWCLFLLLPELLPAQSTPAAATTARLEGQVLSQAGEPLRKAKVWLRPSGSSRQNTEVYSDTSDANGNFVFDAVPPGSYYLSAERIGFLTENYGARTANPGRGTVLTLAAGQAVKDLTFKLSPQGVISGRVVDSDGDPLQGFQVRVMKMFRMRGQSRLSVTGGAPTNDQGEFRIANLSPGTYYAVADNPSSRTFNTETVQRARAPNRQANVSTYYPSGLDASSATPVEITPGSEIRGIEIQMRSEAVYSIRGVVTDAATGKPVAANLNARSKLNPEFGLGMGLTNSKEDGTFELRNLLPGAYVVAAGMNNPGAGVASEEITITDSDVAGVKMTLTQGTTMTGTIKVEGADPKAPKNLTRCTIMLLPTDGSIRAPSAQPTEDGTFELRGVVPGKYVVAIYNMPDGMYLKSVRASGQDAARTMIDLTSGVSGTLDILVSPHGAEISGTVKTDDGDALPGAQVTVWPKEVRPDDVLIGGSVFTTDQNGDFHVTGLAPGDYFVAAWEELEQGLGDDIDFLRHFTSQAVAVTLEEGAHQTAQPKLISREAAAAEAAKLP